ncbi:peptidylprolyl isomerase [Porticoccus sp.]
MSCPSHSTAPHTTTDIPEVRVNGTLIAADDIAREVQYHPAQSPEEGLRKAAEALVIRSLLLQQSEEKCQTSDDATEEARISALLEQQAPAVVPGEEECRRYFDSHKEKFRSPDLLEVSHILIAADPTDEPAFQQAQQSAEALLAQLQQAPGQFAALAKQFSACPSRETGGNLGQLTRGQTTPEFERQVFALNEGLAPKPIESRYGVHVVLVARKINGLPLPYEQVSEQVAAYLAEIRQRLAISRYIHQLIDEADIEGIEMGEALIQ